MKPFLYAQTLQVDEAGTQRWNFKRVKKSQSVQAPEWLHIVRNLSSSHYLQSAVYGACKRKNMSYTAYLSMRVLGIRLDRLKLLNATNSHSSEVNYVIKAGKENCVHLPGIRTL
jgi:hypothetical protein